MIRSLRKGSSNIYFQHEHTGHSIGAKQFEASFKEGIAVLKFTLSPLDGNQKQDEECLHEQPLRSMTLDDSYIIDNLRNYLNAQRQEIRAWQVKVISRGKELSFPVTVKHQAQGAYESLQFAVLVSAA